MSTEHLLGLLTGVLFGFLLQKGRVLRFEKQVGAMLLKDMTIFKFMLSAILVGMVGVYALYEMDIISLSHKPMNAGAVIVGGLLFGAGWAFMGYCPGTSIGALAEGRWSAIFAIGGMVAGAALHAELYPFFKSTVLAWKDYGKIGLPDSLGVYSWAVIVPFWAVVIALFYWFEKKNL